MIPINPSWITDHKLHRPENSGFLALVSGKMSHFRLWAEPIVKDGEIISTAIFEEYPDTAAYWGSFTWNRKRFLMRCHGRIGLFTKPEHRCQGHAQTAVKRMLVEISDIAIPNTINMIAGDPRILHRFTTLEWPTWAAVRAPIGRNFWEEDLKYKITHRNTPPHVTNATAASVLKSKGYVETMIDGRLRIHNETNHPDHGTLRRTETIRTKQP